MRDRQIDRDREMGRRERGERETVDLGYAGSYEKPFPASKARIGWPRSIAGQGLFCS